ncbi:MAG: hypothetical protein K2X27_26035 [Candidatus Obscuribacterales bacterium]|nr:hypothetical protein [Candidatus Obscuribacterales bacterium]
MAEPVLIQVPAPDRAPVQGGAVLFSDLGKRLLGFERSKQSFKYFNPEKPGPWLRKKNDADGKVSFEDDYDAFKASLLEVEENVRIYSIEGHKTKIILKESYAAQLDEVRILRLELEDDRSRPNAAARLKNHAFGACALPEDLLLELDTLPDSSYFERIYILWENNVEDYWVRQKKKNYNADFLSSAAVEPNGDLLFFKRLLEKDYLRSDLVHEWAHRLAAKHQDADEAFRMAILLEQRQPGWYFPSSYALTDFAEHFAVYGECYLSPDNTPAPLGSKPEFRKLWQDLPGLSPLRALVYSRAMRRVLQSELHRKSSMHEDLLKRCLATESLCVPLAQKLLESFFAGNDKEASKQALTVARFFGFSLPAAAA